MRTDPLPSPHPHSPRPADRPARSGLSALLLLSALGLAACGGGSSSSDGITVTQGDSFTYEVTVTPVTPAASAVTSYTTRTVVGSIDRQSAQVETSSSGKAAQTLLFSAPDTQTGSTQGTTSCTRTVVPGKSLVTFPAGNLTEGQTWSYNYIENCATTGGTPRSELVQGSGKIVAFEAITTAAGAFANAVKYTLTETDTTPSRRSYTCWRDRDLAVTVRCDYSHSGIESSNSVTRDYTQVLAGVDVAAYAASVTTLKRFAGAWKISFTGEDTGDCNFSIATDGSITGSYCYSGDTGDTFTLSGSVDSAGTVTATGSNGQAFMGTLETPLAGGGAWVRDTTLTGAWVATHR